MTDHTTEEKINRAVLVGLNAACLSREENATESSMEELSALLETAGGLCVGTVLQNKDAPDPRTFIGEGKAAEVKALAEAAGADMVIANGNDFHNIHRIVEGRSCGTLFVGNKKEEFFLIDYIEKLL